jgi:hypothetical protein
VMEATELATDMVYEVVAPENEGEKAPPVLVNPDRSALADFARVTTTMYVVTVAPSWAVTTTGTVTDAPSATAIDADAWPDVVATAFTFNEAKPCVVVDVNATEPSEFANGSVYESVPAENDGDREPADAVKPLKVDIVDAARLTAIVYVLVVTPSWAMTTILAVAVPPSTVLSTQSLPVVTDAPFTVIVATADVDEGVNVAAVTALPADEVYDRVPVENDGLKATVLDKDCKEASEDAARVTTIAYVFVVVPSCAVTTTEMVVWPPSVNEITPDCAPDVPEAPFTVRVDSPWTVDGVTLAEETPLATEIV